MPISYIYIYMLGLVLEKLLLALQDETGLPEICLEDRRAKIYRYAQAYVLGSCYPVVAE